MRQALSIAVVVALVTGICIDIVAAAVKVSARQHYYYATSASSITAAVPGTTRGITPDLLPQ
jgi:hypothetical protein